MGHSYKGSRGPAPAAAAPVGPVLTALGSGNLSWVWSQGNPAIWALVDPGASDPSGAYDTQFGSSRADQVQGFDGVPMVVVGTDIGVTEFTTPKSNTVVVIG